MSALTTASGTMALVRGFFGDSVGFGSGLTKAAFSDASGNSTVCQGNITVLRESFDDLRGNLNLKKHENDTSTALNNSAQNVEDLLTTVHPLTYGCYHSIEELSQISMSYLSTFEDFHSVTYNIVHKLGNIYDAIYFLAKH